MNSVPSIYELVEARKRVQRSRGRKQPWGIRQRAVLFVGLLVLGLVVFPHGQGASAWFGGSARAAFSGTAPARSSWDTRVVVFPVVNECQDPEAGKSFLVRLAAASQARGLHLVSGSSLDGACRAEGVVPDLVGPGEGMGRILRRLAAQGALRIRFQTLLADGSDEVRVTVQLRGYAADGRSVFSRNIVQGFDGQTLLEDAVAVMARKASELVEVHRETFAPSGAAATAAASFPTPAVASSPGVPTRSSQVASPPPAPSPPSMGVAGFRDVPRDHWARGALERLRASGLLEGFDNAFEGKRAFSRYEMAVVVDRFLAALRSLESRMMNQKSSPVMANRDGETLLPAARDQG